MKARRYTVEHIIAVLKEAEAGAKVAELCRKYGMSRCYLLQLESKRKDLIRENNTCTKLVLNFGR